MKALVMERFDSTLSLETVDDPDCPHDGVVVRVMACGVCRSDHHAWKGADPDVALPHVMGHEFAGVIEEVGADVHGFAVGDRVTAPFILGCGHCLDCRSGDPTTCNQQQVIGFTGWGAFAERLAVPRADFNLVHLPDALGFDAAAGMGCRVTTAFRAVVDRGNLRPGEWLTVHGCGGVGLSAVMIGAALGAQVLAIDVKDDALAMARQLGATATLNVADLDDVGAAVRAATGGGAHLSVEALGVTATFENSVRGLRKLGRHVQIGMPLGPHETVPLQLLELVYARQISIAGSRGMAARRFPALFGMIAAGRLDVSSLVTGRIALGQAENALRAMDRFQGAGVTVITDFTC
ncbi:zinc-dependent alcohol dehydrogenase family protein [Lutimaribacter sp. EGI FJ00015]|uniref:Zinc-dependent alcohol dehydrogenase family protein n=1 Tax=Lutimaribacter degradans TaxID=2945989 RepID=A0ACC5ZUQ5_9RHOB|nr:zinc-dependent alcohol dehydrogenase family protein [Lutimaribacter sp. EGI FJ00013]MCM2561807.1 zinc-dependent alcohol dehydrogenase family protein [Lutimaribacter sp. EGI FJ00013]MCO0613160.1 zinc-dependent alcohol dehydrogenase family protein [Lutimaribacter sp. EGI FJ00015]MCO0635640.1 zinc-dependent alcohol dehydrogenase family protein [Lutimaribacter sp. EGI FJ00014]